MSTFAMPILQLLHIFPEKLFPDHQFFLYFLMNTETTCLQQSITFNLYSIATYNKHLFTIISIIHIFAIFHCATDTHFFIHWFCFDIKIMKQCLFFFYSNILLKYLYISTLPLIFIIFANIISS